MAKRVLMGVLAGAGILAMGMAGAYAGQDGMSMSGGMKMGSGHMSMSHGSDAPVSASLTVSDCWIRALPVPAPSAGYFVIHNKGGQEAKIGRAHVELQSLMR